MRKIVALLLFLTVVMSLTACVPKKEPSLTGSIANNKYENGFAKIGFNLPEEWKFCTEEEVLQTNSLANYMVSHVPATEIESNEHGKAFLGMMARCSETEETISVVIEKSSLTVEQNYTKAYVDWLFDKMSYITTYRIIGRPTKVTVAGESWYAMQVCCSLSYSYYYETIACKKFGDYFVCIIITTTSSGDNKSPETEGLFTYFYKYDDDVNFRDIIEYLLPFREK